MAKYKHWKLTVDDVKYNIEFYRKGFSKALCVNGLYIHFERSRIFGLTNETHILLGTKSAVLVTIGDNIDLAFNGIYIDSGNKYIPIYTMPKWIWIFIILNSLIFLFAGGGILPIFLAYLGITFSIRISISSKLKSISKVLICILIAMINYLPIIILARIIIGI